MANYILFIYRLWVKFAITIERMECSTHYLIRSLVYVRIEMTFPNENDD